MTRFNRALAASALVLAVAASSGCSPKAEDASKPAAEAPIANPATDQQLMDAAASLEQLARSNATGKALDDAVAKVHAAMAPVHDGVPAAMRAEIETQGKAFDAALAAADRPGVTLAALETYKTVISAVKAPKIPVAVSMLRYIGLRYDTDRKATPPRWEDAAAAAALADKQWSSIVRDFTDPTFQTRVGNVVRSMANAAAAKDSAKAAAAVKEELQIVDYLQKTYAAKP